MVLKTLSIPNGFRNLDLKIRIERPECTKGYMRTRESAIFEKQILKGEGYKSLILVILLILVTGMHTANAASSSGFFGKGSGAGYFTHVKSLALKPVIQQPVAPPKRESVPVSQVSAGSSSAVVFAEPSYPCQIDPSKMDLLKHDIYGVGASLIPNIPSDASSDTYGLTGEIRLYRGLWIQKMSGSEGEGVRFRFAQHAATVEVGIQGRYWIPENGSDHGIPQPCTKEYSDTKKIHAYQKTAFWTGFSFKGKPLYFMGHNLKVTNHRTNETWDVTQDLARSIRGDQSNGFTIDNLATSGCAVCPHDAFYNRELNFGLFKARLMPEYLHWRYGVQFDIRQMPSGAWELTSRSEDWHLGPLLLTAGIGMAHTAVSEAASLAVNLLTAEGDVGRLTDESRHRPLLSSGPGTDSSRIEEASPQEDFNKGRYKIVQTVFRLGGDGGLIEHFTHAHSDFMKTRKLWMTSFDQIDQLETLGTVSSNPALRNLQELQAIDAHVPDAARKDIDASRSSILSTGGAWGIDFTRSAKGEELCIMLAGLKSIARTAAKSSRDPEEILRNLANRLIQKSPTVRSEDIGQLIDHQTVAFIMASNYAGEVHLKDQWANALENEAAKSIAACVNAQRRAIHTFDGEIDADYVRSSIISLKARAGIGTKEAL